MLSVRVGDTPDELVTALVGHLRVPLGDPFQHEWISVPSLGFRSWLRFRLAEQLSPGASDPHAPGRADQGIAANLDLPFPGTLRWLLLDAHARHHGLTHEVDPWQVDRLVWAIMAVLADPSIDVDDRLRPGRRPGATLAGRAGPIADLFDRYSIHRPHMVKAWSEGRDVGPDGTPITVDQAWQPRLYRAVRALVEELHGTRPPAERLAEAIDLAARGRLDIVDRSGRSLPERLFVVGQSIIPADLGPIVVALAEQREVTVLLLSPSARASVDQAAHSARRRADVSVDSWAFPRASEAPSGPNALLARWGMRPMESALLLGAGGLELSRVGSDPVRDDPVPPVGADGPSTLLARIRSDVRTGRAPAGDHPGPDGSIQVHAAPGATRQVEVLRDVLLHLLREDPTLTESDIAVVCPQLGDYAPILSAVLGPSAAREDQPVPDEVPALRYTVIDRDARSFNPVLSAMAALLEHLPGRFDTSVVRDLLHAPAIQARFGLIPEDLDLLSRWIEHARIRWGLDRHHRSEWGVGPDHRANSWASGVDQLMMGVALGEAPGVGAASEEDDGSDRSAAVAVGPVIPMAVDESSIAAAGRLTTAVRALARAHRILMSPQDRPRPSSRTEATYGEPTGPQLADPHPAGSAPDDSEPAGPSGDPTVDPGGDAPEVTTSPVAGSSDGSIRRTVEEWRDRLVEVADLLVRPERFEDWQRARFDDALAQLVAASAAGDGTPAPTPLSFGDVRRLLAPALEGQRVRADLGFGTVVFARPSVLAGVPYRVIAVLGLDEAALPGRFVDGDDLMAAEAFVGDREPRAEARAELLGSLLEARDHLIVTCSSRDVRTNEAVPHAVVLDELLDTVEATLAPPPSAQPGDQDAPAGDRSIVRVHPRQGYDPSNFSPDGDGPFSFDPTARIGALALVRGSSESASTHPPGVLLTGSLATESTASDEATVALADLRAFFKHPVRTFLRNALGITLPKDAEEEDTLLPVTLGGLDNWAVGEALLHAHAALSPGGAQADPDAAVAAVTETFRIRGVLPPESVSRPQIETTLEEVMALVSRATELEVLTAISDPVPVPVDVTLGSGERLHGVVDAGPHGLGWTPGLPPPGPVTLSYSRYKPGRLLGVALDLLALGAAHPDIAWRGVVITRAMTKSKKEVPAVLDLRLPGEGPSARRASCIDALDRLVAQYRDGSRLALPLFEQTSHFVATPAKNGGSQLRKARSEWGDPQGRSWRRVECRDPYHQMAFGPISFEELDQLDLDGHTLRGEAERLWHTITGAIAIEDLS